MSKLTPIQTITVGASGIVTMDFTAIPQTYKDLCLKLSIRQSGTTGGSNNVWDNYTLNFNNSGSSENHRALVGQNADAIQNYTHGEFYLWSNIDGSTASTFTNTEVYIPNYTGSYNKSYICDSVVENNSASAWMSMIQTGLWSNTAAITSIQVISLAAGTRSFMQHTSATLYGIKNT